MHTLVKPNGTEVQVNDNSLEYARSLGWEKKSGKQKPRTESEEKKPRRGRKPKAE